MYCTNCQAPLLSTGDICPFCGTPIPFRGEDMPPAISPITESSEDTPYTEFGPLVETVSLSRGRSISSEIVPFAPAPQIISQTQPQLPYQPQPFLPSSPPFPIPTPAQKSQSNQRFGIWLSTFATLLILFILSGAGLIYYTAVAHPAELNVHATAVAQNFLTVQARDNSPQYIYMQATSKIPSVSDPLSNQHSGQPNLLPDDAALGCSFQAGAYHVLVQQQYRSNDCDGSTSFTNFALQIQMTIIQGRAGGILFRMKNTFYKSYVFNIDRSGYYSTGSLNGSITNSKIFSDMFDSSIRRGLNQTNLLTVIALGNTFYLYINRQFITQFSDSTFQAGQIGLLATSYQYPTADVAFSNLQIWKL